jgi:hypothetical protein
MADDHSQSSDRRRNRGRKAARVIEATAVDVTPTVEARAERPAATPESEPTAPQADAAPASQEAESRTEPEGSMEREPRDDAAAGPDIIPPPQPPPQAPEKPRYALPIAAAGLVGALFGAGAGAVAPSLFGAAQPIEANRFLQLEQNVGEIARRAQAPTAPSNAAEVQALQQRLATIEAEVKRRLDGQDQKLAAQPAPAPSAAAPVNLAPLAGRIDALDRALAALDQKTEFVRSAAAEGLRTIEPRLTELTSNLNRTAQRVEVTAAAPVYGAAQALNQAFQRGAPFKLELGALEALGVKPEQLQALRASAEKGAPSIQQIADAFRPLAMQAARAGQPAATGIQSIFDGIVRSRAAGPGAADTPEGHVSAIEKALSAGDIPAALSAWAKLPEASRKATEAWASTARERDAAAAAIRNIQDQALAALRKTAP